LAAKKAAPGTTEAEKIIQTHNVATVTRSKHLFGNAHAIAKNSRPLTDYVWLCELDHKKGVNLENTYQNDKSCKEMIKSIVAVEYLAIKKLVSEAKFLTVMSDGSVDVSVIENEIVYIHFASKGVTHSFFVKVIHCGTANAIGIYNAIMQALKSLESPDHSLQDVQNKLVAFAGDGASVNTGQMNGVIAHLRNKVSPEIIMVHCMAHRLELAFKQAFKKSKLFTQLDSLLNELFKMYHHSAKQLTNLRTTGQALGLDVPIPTRVGGDMMGIPYSTGLEQHVQGIPSFCYTSGSGTVSCLNIIVILIYLTVLCQFQSETTSLALPCNQ